MGYKDEDFDGRISSNKSAKGPHPDADRCLRYAYESLKEVQCMETLEFQIYDYDQLTGIVKEPIYIAFYWRKNGNRFGTTISFHQDFSSFAKSLDRWIAKFRSDGKVVVKNVTSMNMYK